MSRPLLTIATTVTDKARAALVRAFNAIGTGKRVPKRRHDPNALERRGEHVLTAPAVAPPLSAVWIVRIFYLSAGDEILACDSEPLTYQARDRLSHELNASDALGWTTRRTDGSCVRSYGRSCGERARLVTLPSQGPPPVLIAAPAPVLVAAAVPTASARCKCDHCNPSQWRQAA
jgi:hypothetical protein